MNQFVYLLGNSLYINLTNRCTARCVFCALSYSGPLEVQGYELRLKKEPTVQEILDAIQEHENKGTKIEEMVFCGYGEPTLRLKGLKEIALKLKERSYLIRLNTNGHGSLIHKRNIVPELSGLIDEVRVSLNAVTVEDYEKIMQPKLKGAVFEATKEFISECHKVIPKVVISTVTIPQLDLQALKKLAKELNAHLMLRELDQVGIPQPIVQELK